MQTRQARPFFFCILNLCRVDRPQPEHADGRLRIAQGKQTEIFARHDRLPRHHVVFSEGFSSEAATRRVSAGSLSVAATAVLETVIIGARSAGTPAAAAMPFVARAIAAKVFSRCSGDMVRTVSCKWASSGMMLCLVPA